MKHFILFISIFQVFWVNAQDLDSLLNNYFNQKAFQGCIAAVSIDGKTKHFGQAGYADLRTKTKFDKETKTRIASLVKPMTAIAIMQLVEKGKISLNDPIQKYIPEYTDSLKDKITIEQVLSHTAGIPGYLNKKEKENQKDYKDLEAAFSIFKNRPLIAKPGEKFSYTSYGYVVLGILIERVTKTPYIKHMQKLIWEPLKMTNTEQEKANTIYFKKANTFHKDSRGKIKYENPTNLSDRVPGGGVHSSIEDLISFGNAVLNNSMIADSSLTKMLVNQKPIPQGNGYGLGFTLYGENPDHGIIYGHGGAQIGASNLIFIIPKRKAVIVVLSNTSGANRTVGEIAVELLNYLH